MSTSIWAFIRRENGREVTRNATGPQPGILAGVAFNLGTSGVATADVHARQVEDGSVIFSVVRRDDTSEVPQEVARWTVGTPEHRGSIAGW